MCLGTRGLNKIISSYGKERIQSKLCEIFDKPKKNFMINIIVGK